MNDNNKKSAWDDLSESWKKLAAVIGAVTLLSGFIVEVFGFSPKKTLPPLAFFGVLILAFTWYVEKQANYTKKELEDHKEESKKLVDSISSTMIDIQKTVNDTRKDTLRIQLLMYIQTDPTNIDTIIRLAETYFVELGGDWYMTSEFLKWSKTQDVMIPLHINSILDKEHNSK